MQIEIIINPKNLFKGSRLLIENGYHDCLVIRQARTWCNYMNYILSVDLMEIEPLALTLKRCYSLHQKKVYTSKGIGKKNQ